MILCGQYPCTSLENDKEGEKRGEEERGEARRREERGEGGGWRGEKGEGREEKEREEREEEREEWGVGREVRRGRTEEDRCVSG